MSAIVTQTGTPCYVETMRQRQKPEQSAETPPPPWLHEDAFAWLSRVRPKTTVVEVREQWIELFAAAYKMCRTHEEVAKVVPTSKRVVRSWVDWLKKHAPEDAAKIDRAAPSERLPKP